MIAEGIENEHHLSYLVRNECDMLQGFYFSRPLYPEDVPVMLTQNFSDQIRQVVDSQLKKVVDNDQ